MQECLGYQQRFESTGRKTRRLLSFKFGFLWRWISYRREDEVLERLNVLERDRGIYIRISFTIICDRTTAI